MSFIKKSTALAFAGLIFSAGAAYAQAGGGNETPDAAKDKGTASGGTEGKSEMSKGEMSKGEMSKDGGAMKEDGGAMKKDDKM